MRIAVLGYGTVGEGFINICADGKHNKELEIVSILVRNKDKYKDKRFYSKITDNIDDVFASEPDIVVELMGGKHPAFDYIMEALRRGKNVVSANKDMIAECGQEIATLAKEKGVDFRFEAAVAGGIPIIKPLMECLRGNEIQKIQAILNGTTNFILTKMYEQGASYEEVLKEAQELGFAEADPTVDVKGLDATRKLSILSQIAFSKSFYWKDFMIKGIDEVDAVDISIAKSTGNKIKLIGRCAPYEDGIHGATVNCFVGENTLIGQINYENNVVRIEGDWVKGLMFAGKGAGMYPTGSAVFGDVLDIIEGRPQDVGLLVNPKGRVYKYYPYESRYILRIESEMADKVSELLGDYIVEECYNVGSIIAYFVDVPNETVLQEAVDKLEECFEDGIIKTFPVLKL